MSEDINKIIGKHVLFIFTKIILGIIFSIICIGLFILATSMVEITDIFGISNVVEKPNYLLFGTIIPGLFIILICFFLIKTSTYTNLFGRIVISLGVFILYFSVSTLLLWIEKWFIGSNPIQLTEFIDGLKSYYWKFYLPFLFPIAIVSEILLIIWGIYILRKNRIIRIKNSIQV